MATVKLFGNLRKVAGGATFAAPGEDVGVVLQALCKEISGLHQAIFQGDALIPFIRVMVDGQDIELIQGLHTRVSESSAIAVFPPLAGGQ